MLYEKRSRFLKHPLNTMVRAITWKLEGKGVGELRVSYPRDIARHRGNKLTVNFWNCSYTIKRFRDVGEDVGIKVVEVDERGASKDAPCAGKLARAEVSRGIV